MGASPAPIDAEQHPQPASLAGESDAFAAIVDMDTHTTSSGDGIGSEQPGTHSRPADPDPFGLDPQQDQAKGDSHSPSADLQQLAVALPFDPADPDVKPDELLPDQGDGREAPSSRAVATIVDLWRQRQDLRRAEGRLNLQCQAICRRACGGDKEAAHRMWTALQKDGGPDEVAIILVPYRTAIAALDESAAMIERQLAHQVRQLTLWAAWAKGVRGLAELSFAGLIGEAGRSPGEYRSVSALWKRFGLAVLDGERQRRVKDADQALLQGYAPQRRAFAYVVSTNLMRSQRAGDPFRQVYDHRKAYELAREIPKGHAHNRALRVMVKELLKRAWVADRAERAA